MLSCISAPGPKWVASECTHMSTEPPKGGVGQEEIHLQISLCMMFRGFHDKHECWVFTTPHTCFAPLQFLTCPESDILKLLVFVFA